MLGATINGPGERSVASRLRSWCFFLAGWTVVGLLFSAVSYAGAFSGNRRISLTDALAVNIGFFYLWGFFSIPVVAFCRRFPIELRPLRIRNILIHGPVVFLVAVLHQTIHMAGRWYLSSYPRQQHSFAEFFRAYFGVGLYLNLIIASLIIIAAHALMYYQGLRASELEQSSLKARLSQAQAQLAQAQLKALKMQLHPHFLFNTLHSISSLVLNDPPKANKMIARLGDFLRLTLEHSDEQVVTLHEEVEFIRCYLEIEQVRFEKRLTVSFDIARAARAALVPQLILQPIVENAIQHGIAPRLVPGRISIEAERANDSLYLKVKDNGPGMSEENSVRPGHGVGLENVRARLNEIYGAEFSFETTNNGEGGVSVLIRIPFRLNASLQGEELTNESGEDQGLDRR